MGRVYTTWYIHYLPTLGIPTTVLVCTRHVHGGISARGACTRLKKRIINVKEALLRAQVLLPVMVVREVVRRVFRSFRTKSVKDWIGQGSPSLNPTVLP